MNFSINNYFKAHAELASNLNIPMFQAGVDLIKQKFEEKVTQKERKIKPMINFS